MKAMKQLLTIIMLSTSVLASYAMAHGSLEPKHGGMVKEAHDMIFELVKEEASTSLYVRDHGKAFPTNDLVATIIILAGKDKTEASFMPSGGNKMMADVVIAEGAKVLVRVSESDHHPVTVRYTF